MAWSVIGNDIRMCEGDYGVALTITLSGTTLGGSDCIRMVIKDCLNGEDLITRDFTDIQENTLRLELTENESAKLPVGNYVYRLDWYQDGSFMDNVIPIATFKVVEKA